jgi:hypothetical protein
MSRSFIYLRRALFGVSCTIVFGLGATQALAEPPRPGPESLRACTPREEYCPCEDGTYRCVSIYLGGCPVC